MRHKIQKILIWILSFSLILPSFSMYVYADELPMQTGETENIDIENSISENNLLNEIKYEDDEVMGISEGDSSPELYYATLPDGTICIYGCDGKGTSLNIPNEIDGKIVTSIDGASFVGYSNFTNITLPETLQTIGPYAFQNCSGFSSITIPDSVTSIGMGAFHGCSSLTDITIPEGVTSIENSTFGRCSNLINVTLSNNITTINDSAFSDCSSLSSIILPEGATSIGMNAFYGCSNLNAITLPKTIISIEEDAFANCGSDFTIYGTLNSYARSFANKQGISFVEIEETDENEVLFYVTHEVLDDGTISITGCYSFVVSLEIPNEINGRSVTRIGDGAFAGCSSLSNITLPDSVTSIGDNAFNYCSSLTNITIPEGVTNIAACAFIGCSSLTNITIPEGVTSIERSTFSGCSNLSNIILPEGLSNIGDNAFWGCSSLSSITIPSSVTSIGMYAFSYCSNLVIYGTPDSYAQTYANEQGIPFVEIEEENDELSYLSYEVLEDGTICITDCDTDVVSVEVPDEIDGKTVTSIGNTAFDGCSNLSSIILPDDITSIGVSAFYDCSNLNSITLPENLTYIGGSAFHNCNSLTTVNLPETLTYIGDNAFWGCSSLGSITIPEGITSIEDMTFYQCSSLSNVNLSSSITSIGYSAFSQCGNLGSVDLPDEITTIGERAFESCSSLNTINLPEDLTYIGDYAFNGCSSLSSITLPDGISNIGDSVFGSCDNLSSIILPENLTSIGYQAFSGCSMTSITLPSGLVEIDERAFSGCNNLSSIILPEGLTSIGSEAFSSCGNLSSITLPESLTSIGSEAFAYCYNLNSITIFENVRNIGDSAFEGCGADFVIYGMADSYAQTYANEWNIPFRKIGDDDDNEGEGDELSYLTYEVLEDGTISITGRTNDMVSLNIPDEIDGKIVTSIGDMAFFDCVSLSSITLPNGLTSIGNRAFTYCDNLSSIILPDGLTSIGTRAFYKCFSLNRITLPKGISTISDGMFDGCSSLSSIAVPDGVISIGSSAFYDCSNLNSITLPEIVTSIGDSAFKNCESLNSIEISENVTSIGDSAFEGCGADFVIYGVPDSYAQTYANEWNIPFRKIGDDDNDGNELSYLTYEVLEDGTIAITDCNTDVVSLEIPNEIDGKTVTVIGDFAFEECTSLTSVILSNRITTIGNAAFRFCNNLTSIILPEGLTDISRDVFYGCSSLGNIIIPDSVTTIGDAAFYGCSSLDNIIIPDGVTTIGESAFASCDALSSITLPEGVTDIGISAFESCHNLSTVILPDTLTSIKDYTFYDCSNLTSIYLPSNLTSIGLLAFGYCISLDNITLPNSLTNIGNGAFSECNSLSNITLPENLSILNQQTFMNCSSLTDIVLPNSLTNIGVDTFSGCSSLSSITLSDNLSAIGAEAFSNCSNLDSITIPENVTYMGDAVFEGCGADFVIYGIANSYAQTYAKEWNIPFREIVVSVPYTIIFNNNNISATGIMENQVLISNSGTKLNPNMYNCNGYIFTGWNTKVDGSGTAFADQADGSTLSTKKDDVVTLYAQWDKENYTITYNLNSGKNGSNPSNYDVTTETITLKNPSRTGYTFGGWYSDSAFTQKVTSIPKGSTGNKTFYAKWTINKYHIAFNGNGNTSGSMSTLSSCKYGSSYTLTANAFKKTGYTFTGWNTKADGSGTAYANKASVKNLTSTNGKTITLYAQWKKVTYTITYNLNGGKNSSNLSSYDVTTATITLKNPTRTGYTFGGWYSDSGLTKKVTTIPKGSTGNKTLYAKWTINKYNIAFNGNKSTSGSMKTLSSCKYGSSYTLTANAFKKTGYTFTGWNTKADGSGTTYKNKASVKNLTSTNGKTITLYAQWKKVTYSITYNLNGGKNNSKNPATYTVTTSDIKLQNPTRTGYTFGGWYSDSKLTKKVTTITKGSTGNKTLYAKWTVNKYNIAFNGNKSTSGSMKTLSSCKYGSSYTLTANAFKKTGYTFTGWNTKADGSGTTYKNKASVKNLTSANGKTITLYAQWKKATYTITYNLNGGKNNSKNPSTYTITSLDIKLQNPSRTGYTFGGWYSDSKLTKKVTTIKKGSTGNKTLYAKWRKNKI